MLKKLQAWQQKPPLERVKSACGFFMGGSFIGGFWNILNLNGNIVEITAYVGSAIAWFILAGFLLLAYIISIIAIIYFNDEKVGKLDNIHNAQVDNTNENV